jgi:hypothetical protein
MTIDCLTDIEEIRYIENVLKNQMNCNIYSTKECFRYFLSNPALRAYAVKEILDVIRKSDRFPLFIIIHLIINDNSEKHTVVMTVIPSLKGMFDILIFDTNGLNDKGHYKHHFDQFLSDIQKSGEINQVIHLVKNKNGISHLGCANAIFLHFISRNIHYTSIPEFLHDIDDWISDFYITNKHKHRKMILALLHTLRDDIHITTRTRQSHSVSITSQQKKTSSNI